MRITGINKSIFIVTLFMISNSVFDEKPMSPAFHSIGEETGIPELNITVL